jgi:hypothetical protein
MLTKEQTEKALTDFYTSFPYTKLTVLDDSLTYKTPFGYNNEIRKEAQELIDKKGLPLIAKTFSSNSIFQDVVLIEIKND